ncbi:DHA2 family efflux MFS transporter permease subunit [Martelella sp. HB161492]|uniref:DHA2 family efflux MFS transporter permease subunit n=1 Tax=Martelella sp. HB161492 TaxID=2720726 RepID=UPI00159194A7|nr:DHA2 family efflux MFS transporter permease subunit [Martelella sp. HB161492]
MSVPPTSGNGLSQQCHQQDRLDRSVWKIAAVALFGGLLAQLDATIVNVSLSTLATELHSTLQTIQWVMSGYLLALALALPLSGWLVGRIGAKRLYLWCFASFTLLSAVCGLAWSAHTLIAFRLLQGVSGGLLAPMAQMMIARAAGRQMARVAGYMALPVLLAPVLGPVIAGTILQYASWRWLFLINLPIGVLALVLAILFLPDERDAVTAKRLDWVGLALLSPGLGLFLYGADKIGESMGRVLFVAGIVMMVAFLADARRKRGDALIDLRLFRRRAFSIGALTQFLSNGAQFAGQFLIPAFLIGACGRSSAEMGWMLAPMGGGMLVTYSLMGKLTDRFGLRQVAAGGALLTLLATIPFVYMAFHGLDLVMLELALFLRGMGMSAIGLPTMTAAYMSVSKPDLPMATTSMNIVQRLGGPTFTTLCASFLALNLDGHAPHPSVSTPYALAFLALCLIHVLTLLASVGLPGRHAGVSSDRQD